MFYLCSPCDIISIQDFPETVKGLHKVFNSVGTAVLLLMKVKQVFAVLLLACFSMSADRSVLDSPQKEQSKG